MSMTMRKTKRDEHRLILKTKIMVYDCGFAQLSEPSKARIQLLPHYQKVLKTYRFDYDEFVFVRCQINGEKSTLAIRFQPNQIERSSCQLLANWDPRASITSPVVKKK